MSSPIAQHGSELTQLAHLPGEDVGWCDDHGDPAPWPDDFFDPASDWRPSNSDTPPVLAEDESPF